MPQMIKFNNTQKIPSSVITLGNFDGIHLGHDKLIKNYGIGAQIIKSLDIEKMILVTRSKKKVVGLDGYGIKIIKQEIIK